MSIFPPLLPSSYLRQLHPLRETGGTSIHKNVDPQIGHLITLPSPPVAASSFHPATSSLIPANCVNSAKVRTTKARDKGVCGPDSRKGCRSSFECQGKSYLCVYRTRVKKLVAKDLTIFIIINAENGKCILELTGKFRSTG